MKFICPKCKGQLNILGGSAVCAAGHSYDKSRYGYYNLFLCASGGVHGDNREMVAARSEFLDTDAYLPLAERVAATAAELIDDLGVLLDIGSGEGYYTRHVADALTSASKNACILGFDISKEAVKRAARRVPSATFAFIPPVFTAMFALLSTSRGVSASISSKPFAKRIIACFSLSG